MQLQASGLKLRLWIGLLICCLGNILTESLLYSQEHWQNVLQELVDESTLIVWGQVVQGDSYWQTDERGTHIYTTVHIEPLEGIQKETLILEVTGGTVEEITESVSNSPSFSVDEEVIVFLRDAPYRLVDGSFSKLEIVNGHVTWAGHRYPVETFLDGLALMAADILPDSFWATPVRTSTFSTLATTPIISGILPNKASAGTQTEVSISGSNFGATQGSSKVEFYYRSGSKRVAQVLSWSDTQIRCTVPAKASSGPVTVTTSDGKSNEVLFRVTFGYGGAKWPGSNPTVKYWVNENTSDCTGEADAVRRAASKWNSAGPLSFQYQGSHTQTTSGYNEKNEIMWGSTGSLAVTIVWSISSTDEIVECDMVFNDSFNWSTSSSPGSQEVDVETVALHELGHFLNLSDLYGNVGDGVYDVDKVMYGITLIGSTKRSLRSDDRSGVNWIYSSSSSCITPSAPTDINATDGTYCDQVQLNWNSVSGATGYEIWRNTSNSSGFADKVADDTVAPYHDTSANPGSTYYYWVKAQNACGTSSFSSSDSGYRSTETVPAVPGGVSATDGTYCDNVQLTWNSVSGATGYEVWRSTSNSSGSAAKVADNMASPYNDTSANPGTIYYYWVKAQNACGASSFSSSDSGFRSTQIVAIPSGVSASDGTYCNLIQISWNPVAGATAYEIWCNASSTFDTATKVADDTISPYHHRSVLSETTYYYWVKAKNSCDTSDFSIFDTGYRSSTIDAPTNINASDGAYYDRVRVTWDAVPGATGYEIWRGTNHTSGFAVKIGDDIASPYNDYSVENSTHYYYWVKAKNLCGTSNFGDYNTGYLNEYQLTLSSSAGGSIIQPGEGARKYVRGTSLTIAASPNTGYWFVNWGGSAVVAGKVTDPESATTQVSIDGDYSLRAVFQSIDVQPILYVDHRAPGGSDGSTWSKALIHLQDALSLAQSSDGIVTEIRVSQGTYSPDQGIDVQRGDRNATFQLINGMQLKGGYAGFSDPDPNVRNFELYATILSGDLDRNDTMLFNPGALPTEATRTENSIHIVTGDGTNATAIIEGCIISGANGSESGGGFVNRSGDPTIIHCTFTANSARRGGGLYNKNSHPQLHHCAFIGNFSEQTGAGILNDDGSHSDVNECVFISNTAETGAGIANTNESSLNLSICTFDHNHAFRYGGAILDANDCISTLRNCLLVGNTADWHGAALSYENDCQVSVYHCTFADNWADNGGSAVSSLSTGRPSTLDFMNCIFWNRGSEFLNEDTSIVTVTYSDIRGGWPGEGNIDLDPQFINSQMQVSDSNDNDVWFQGDYHLLPNSPCIDAGDPDYSPQPNELDIDGTFRIMGNRIDMGTDEFESLN